MDAIEQYDFAKYRSQRSEESRAEIAEVTRQAVAIVLADHRGERLGGLTASRAKPAVPFGGKFRIIDFALSNCLNSGIRRIGICAQYMAQSLIRHVQQGWSFLDGRSGEFIELLAAQQGIDQTWYRGSSDSVFQNLGIVQRHGPQLVLIVPGDHVYKMDYGQMLAEHAARGADVSVACVEVPLPDATQRGIVDMDGDCRIRSVCRGAAQPAPLPGRADVALLSMGIYAFDAEYLYDQLHRDADDPVSSRDFGRDIIPRSIAAGARVFAHRFSDSCIHTVDGHPYWRDIGTVDAYWAANIDLTRVKPEFDLYDADWPIWTHQRQLPPAKFVFRDDDRRGMAVDSLVAGGCIIDGATVRRSVLFNSVHVHDRATVEDSVILPGTDIGAGAVVRRAVVDRQCRIPAGARIGVDAQEDRARFRVSDGGIALVADCSTGRCRADRPAGLRSASGGSA